MLHKLEHQRGAKVVHLYVHRNPPTDYLDALKKDFRSFVRGQFPELRLKGSRKSAKKIPNLAHIGDAPLVIGVLRCLLDVARCGGLSPFLRPY